MDLPTSITVLIVGAGPLGLAAAKTYLQCSPTTSLLIIDRQPSLGGVWAKEKLYPGLRTNNQHGTFEFSDFPMHSGFGVQTGKHISGESLYMYLKAYAERWGLVQRVQLGVDVETCEKVGLEDEEREGMWRVKVRRGGEESTITCSKLIIATGLTSTPRPITLPGQSTFTPLLINFAALPDYAPTLLKNTSVSHITIYGCSKAAYDCAYLFASAGKRITWIMRASGHGAVWMAPPFINLGPFRCWLEKLVTTRFFTLFSPCVWGDADGFGAVRRILHETTWGGWVVDKFWETLSGDTLKQSGLLTRDETGDLKKLIPDEDAFWHASGLGILNYPSDVHEFVRSGQVRVVRKDIERLEGKTVKLAGGEEVHTDVMICSTGWKWTCGVKFVPEDTHADLGVPSTDYTTEQTEMWSRLEREADLEILRRFPKLANQPKSARYLEQETAVAVVKEGKEKQFTSWRLWRGMAPPASGDRSLIFLSMILNLQTAIRAEISSLWAYAYLNGQLDDKPRILSDRHASSKGNGLDVLSKARMVLEEGIKRLVGSIWRGDQPASPDRTGVHTAQLSPTGDLRYETALFNRFGRWRCPCGYGAKFPDFAFDGVPYYDLLLGDLGLRSWRKGWGWVGEIFGGGYGLEDYRGVVEEWIGKKKGRR